ncbi:MAG TPA: twin-arginine translocase subunit TatC [Chitinophagaceae bacterium]|nr:twin-arginine translocase subunit TatC [Chitinophagaceae bacterium]
MATDKKEKKSLFQRTRGEQDDKAEMSFIDHLEELRWNIIKSVLAVTIGAVFCFVYIDWIFDNIITAPLNNNFITYRWICDLSHRLNMGDALCLPNMHIELQNTTFGGSFYGSITLAITLGFIVAFPYVLYQIWSFVKPALKTNELKYTRGIIFWITIFFLLGASFGYYILAPYTFNFLSNYHIGTKGILINRPSLSDYIENLTDVVLGCGIAFQMPMVSYFLTKIGLITPGFLKSAYRYAIVIIIVIAAVITPSGDIVTLTIVALPLLLLYWLGIVISSRVNKNLKKKEAEEWS